MRRSPSVPCPFCNSRDWSYDQDKLKWICNPCLISGTPIPPRPDYDQSFNFESWYESCMDEWETASRYLADLEKENPELERDKIILSARTRKSQAVLSEANDAATAAASLKIIRDSFPTGDVYINVPGLEIRIKW